MKNNFFAIRDFHSHGKTTVLLIILMTAAFIACDSGINSKSTDVASKSTEGDSKSTEVDSTQPTESWAPVSLPEQIEGLWTGTTSLIIPCDETFPEHPMKYDVSLLFSNNAKDVTLDITLDLKQFIDEMHSKKPEYTEEQVWCVMYSKVAAMIQANKNETRPFTISVCDDYISLQRTEVSGNIIYKLYLANDQNIMQLQDAELIDGTNVDIILYKS
jgi:hypothetical protein